MGGITGGLLPCAQLDILRTTNVYYIGQTNYKLFKIEV